MIQYENEHITVFQSALYQTTSTVIQTADMLLIVDPNWLMNEVEIIRDYVDRVKGERATYLLFTHGDFDHIIGYQAFPDAKTIGSIGLHKHPAKEAQLQAIKDFDAKHYIERSYPIRFPELDIVIHENGQQLQVGATTLTFYLAPGHTADGLLTIVEPLDVMLAGDYLSDFEKPFIDHSARAYRETLDRISDIFAAHSIAVLVPGHGQATANTSEMERRLHMASDHLERLYQAVMSGDNEALEQLRCEHGFPSALTDACHKENVRVISSEYVNGE